MSERAGVLPVDKPEGPTSHDIVAVARRALGTRRVGHTGTLDPFASGLLLLCVGPATRVAQYLGGLGKTYEARLRLGVATDTDDATGVAIAASDDWFRVTEADLRGALARQVGDIEQVPPLFSAKKIAGERAHRLARAGQAATLAPVRVRIESIRVTRFEPPDADFEIACGTGTYVRSVARDAGRELGVGAHLTRLRRTRIGGFDVAAAVPADRLSDPAAVAGAWVDPLDALRHLPRIDLAPDQASLVSRGGTIPLPDVHAAAGPVALAAAGRLVAVAEVSGDRIQPRTVFP